MNELDKAVETLKPDKSNGRLTIIGEVVDDKPEVKSQAKCTMMDGIVYDKPEVKPHEELEQVEDVHEYETKDTRSTIMLVGIIGVILVFYMISHQYYTDGVIWHAVIAWAVTFVSALPIISAIMKHLKKLLKI